VTKAQQQQEYNDISASTSTTVKQDGDQINQDVTAALAQQSAQATAAGSADTTMESPLTNNVELSSTVPLRPISFVTFNPNDSTLPGISLGDLHIPAAAPASPVTNGVASTDSAVGNVTSDSSTPTQLQEVVVSAEAPWWMRAWHNITSTADAVGSDVANAYHAAEGDVGAAVSGVRNWFSQSDSTQSDSVVWPGETAALQKIMDDPGDPLYVEACVVQ